MNHGRAPSRMLGSCCSPPRRARCSQEEKEYQLHIFFECSKLSLFWDAVFQELSQGIQVMLKPELKLVLFGVSSQPSWPDKNIQNFV
ncbi:hypothetical protein NDU88_009921 [Pleurodeles waltl]|uniref:Uncharacterized protein n=1 Tax=Pleurodeles waltl TaxID=8319 RepID=A0AAV7RWL6_PLEWA|nr:hypothetical protein NDU88_009921 [Pleurodeles waltl]